MKDTSQMTLSEIAVRIPGAVTLLESHHLDYCCKGKISLENACRDNNLAIQELVNSLNRLEGQNREAKDPDYNQMPLQDLIFFIVGHHHGYIKDISPIIELHLNKVISKHGERYPKTAAILELFTNIKMELTQHMAKEEKVLFPYINTLLLAKKGSVPYTPLVSIIATPIQTLEQEHEVSGKLMEDLRQLCDQYEAPAGACTTHQIVYQELREFESKLHHHIHLENNILFPKAVALENELKDSANCIDEGNSCSCSIG